MTTTYESVHDAHEDKTVRKHSKVSSRESYNYEPERDAQGTAIERLKAHADIVIPKDEATTMNCAIFTDLMYVCNYICAVENIKERRVYPAICSLGRDRCYHKMKVNHGDIFTDIAELVKIGRLSIGRPSKMDASMHGTPIFNDVRTTKFRTTKQTLAIAVETSSDYGVKTSDLNLYHTLTGLKYITENESKYILIADEDVVKDVLRRLTKADNALTDRRERLQSWMGI